MGRPAPDEVVLPVSVPAFVGLDGKSGTVVPSEIGEVDVTSGPDGGSHADGTGGAGRGNLVRVITVHHLHLLWVEECLQHLSSHAQVISGPASHMAEQRRLPRWR